MVLRAGERRRCTAASAASWFAEMRDSGAKDCDVDDLEVGLVPDTGDAGLRLLTAMEAFMFWV